MPEEQNQVQEQAPQLEEHAPAPTAPAAKPKGKSNGCVIAIIIVAIIVVLIGVGIFMAYRYVKSKVNISKDSASVNIGGNQSSISTTGSTYDTVTEQNPTVDIIKRTNDSLKPIFAKVYGGAKVNAWTSLETDSGSLGYATKNKVTAESYAQVETELTSAGYVKSSNYSSSDGAIISATKGDTDVVIYLSSSEGDTAITVTISKVIADSSVSTDTAE